MSFFGIKVIESPYATETVYSVCKWPTKKKRRGFMVKKELRPCAYMIQGHTAVLHPSLAVKLRNFT